VPSGSLDIEVALGATGAPFAECLLSWHLAKAPSLSSVVLHARHESGMGAMGSPFAECLWAGHSVKALSPSLGTVTMLFLCRASAELDKEFNECPI
jgi:hypothetical protein